MKKIATILWLSALFLIASQRATRGQADWGSIRIGSDGNGPTVQMENSKLRVTWGYYTDEAGNGEHAIREFLIKGFENQVDAFLDASADRGKIAGGADAPKILYDGADRKTVRINWYKKGSSSGIYATHDYSIFPDSLVVKIDYVRYGINVVDIGKPGGAASAASLAYSIYGSDAYAQAGNRKTIAGSIYPGTYYDRAESTDPDDGDGLNYHGSFLLGQYNKSNNRGYARVFPVSDVDIVKLLWYQGSEYFADFGKSRTSYTGYLYGVTSGSVEIQQVGMDLADGKLPGISPTSVLTFTQEIVDAENLGNRAIADVDADGFNDVVATKGENSLVWYRYPDWTQTVIRDLADFRDYRWIRSDDLKAADIDSDGDPDVVTRIGTSQDDDINGVTVWFENPGPGSSGTAWARHDIGPNQYAKDIDIQDLDRDGWLDVVTREHTRVQIWFQDPSAGWTKKEFRIPGHEGMDTADLDGDGDIDIVLNGFWMETPANPRSGTYVEHEIAKKWWSQASGSWQDNNSKVATGDINRDGRIDVILSHSEKAGYPVNWYSAADPKGAWTEHVVTAACEYCHTLQAADFNRDGFLDILAGGMPKSAQKGLQVYYGNGGKSWKAVPIQDLGSYSAELGDIGKDGDIDIITVRNWDAAPMEIWENQSRSKFPLKWTYLQVTTRHKRAFGLTFGDVDHDGARDILSGPYWYKNPGGDLSGTWLQYPLPNAGGAAPDALLFLNVDSDRDADVVGVNANGDVNWLEAADLAAGSWKSVKIGSIMADHALSTQGYKTGQIVRGGKPEVVLGSEDGTIVAFQIPANPAGTWPKTVIASGTNSTDIGLGDIDRDGAIDIAAVEGSGLGKISWWKNPGDGSGNWQKVSVGTTDGQWPDRVGIADINKDGRLDIVVTEEEQVEEPVWKTYWFQSPADPAVDPWIRNTITSQYTTNSLDLADMDQDGDTDIVLAEHRGTQKLAIWENGGGGRLTERVIDRGKENHLGARTVDLDGDGDLDIVGIAWDGYPVIHLWRNDR